MPSLVYTDENSTLDEHLLKANKVKKEILEGQPPLYDILKSRTEGDNYYSCVIAEGDLGQYGSLPSNSNPTHGSSSYSRHYEILSDASPKPPASWNSKQTRRKSQDPDSTNPSSQNGVPPPAGYSSLSDMQGNVYATLEPATAEEIAQIVPASSVSYEFDENIPVERRSAKLEGVSQVYNKNVPTKMDGETYSYALVGEIEVSFLTTGPVLALTQRWWSSSKLSK